MIDQSYFVPMLPSASDGLTFERANAIEENLRYLIRQWPAFEVETVVDCVGSYGYLETEETATPDLGAEVTLLQHLPRLLVILSGTGLGYLRWQGAGWERAGGGTSTLTLAYPLKEPSEAAAMAALAGLSIGSSGRADIDVTLAAERADGSLRITRSNVTRLLFRTGATWGLLRAKTACWGELPPRNWLTAAKMKKE